MYDVNRAPRHIVAEDLQLEPDARPMIGEGRAREILTGAGVSIIIAWVSIPLGLLALVAAAALYIRRT